MNRFFPSALVVLAAFVVVGCGGAEGLLATVPPPVELTAGGTGGLAVIPASGEYRGELTVESVQMVRGGNGAWTEVSATPASGSGRGTATVSGSTIRLGRDGEEDALFVGTLTAITAIPGRTAATYADLTAFDSNKERFAYTLLPGSPRTLEIVARTKVVREGDRQVLFDRYKFVLRP